MSDVSVVVAAVLVLLAATIAAGFFRVEVDPVALRPPRRLANEFLGGALLLAIVAIAVIRNQWLASGSQASKALAGGAFFLLVGALLTSSYFAPEHNATFRSVSSLWARSPGPGGGPTRPGLLISGFVFTLLGLCSLVVGSGIFG